MGVLALDQNLFGLAKVGSADRNIPIRLDKFHHLARQRIDQPGLSVGQFKGIGQCIRGKGLTSCLCVLLIKSLRLVKAKISQGECLDFDIERTRSVETVTAAGGHFVIPHIAQTDQGQGVGETGGPIVIAIPQLAQNRDKRFIPQSVDFVQKENQRTERSSGPGVEGRPDPGAGFGIGPFWRPQLLRQSASGTHPPTAQYGQFGFAGAVVESRAHLAREQHSRIATRGRQLLGQGEHRSCLARLPRRVEHKIALLLNHRKRAGHPFRCGQHIVEFRFAGASRIEPAFYGSVHRI